MTSDGRPSAAASAKDAAGRATGRAQDAAAGAERHPAAKWVKGAGQIANGVVHFAIGAIALGVAFGGGGSADQAGAMQAIQESPLGSVALWAVGLALIALALLAFVTAVAESRRDWKDALKEAGRGIAYAAVGATGLVAATGGSSDGESQTESFSAQLMTNPFGALLIGLIGAGIAAIGVYFIVKGAKRTFREDVAPPARWCRPVDVLGTAGYIAKGVAVVIVGALFVIAAVRHDPEEAGGLDGALQSLTTVPGGVIALIAIAVGLMLYGVYCFARGLWSR
jgi:Domain of Unknown Function (DUF1206)